MVYANPGPTSVNDSNLQRSIDKAEISPDFIEPSSSGNKSKSGYQKDSQSAFGFSMSEFFTQVKNSLFTDVKQEEESLVAEENLSDQTNSR